MSFARPRSKLLPEGVLTITEAMAKFKTSQDRLREWRQDGMPVWKAGSLVLVKESDLREWIARNPRRKPWARRSSSTLLAAALAARGATRRGGVLGLARATRAVAPKSAVLRVAAT